MSTTTTYMVETLYRVKDQSSQPLAQVAKGADGAARSMGGFGGAVRAAVTALAGFSLLRVGASAFVGFNAKVEQSTISLAAQEKMLLGGSWDSAMQNATGLFADYQKVAKESVGVTTDFLTMHAGIASSAYRAGLGMQTLKEMTIGATVAAVALGERADMVALDIKQMLSGDVTSRDRTAQILLASQGVSQDAFNKMNQKRRNQIVVAALNDPALKSAAKAMGQSFDGVTSTLKDNLQIAAGKIGLPLFKAITAEVKKWNEWIEKNPQKIKQFATDFTGALMKGFEIIKKVASFVVDNKALLLSLAKAMLVAKGVGFVTGGLSGIVSALTRLGGSGPGSFGALASGMGRLNLALGALPLIAGAATVVADHVDAMQTRKIDAGADWLVNRRGLGELARARGMGAAVGMERFSGRDATFAATAGAAAAEGRIAARVLDQARHAGYLKEGRIDSNAIWAKGSAAGIGVQEIEGYIAILDRLLSAEVWANAGKAMSFLNDQIGRLPALVPAAMTALADPAGLLLRGLRALPNVKDDAKKIPKAPAPNVKVEVTVMSDDPDRFSMGLGTLVHDALKNPGASRHVWREG